MIWESHENIGVTLRCKWKHEFELCNRCNCLASISYCICVWWQRFKGFINIMPNFQRLNGKTTSSHYSQLFFWRSVFHLNVRGTAIMVLYCRNYTIRRTQQQQRSCCVRREVMVTYIEKQVSFAIFWVFYIILETDWSPLDAIASTRQQFRSSWFYIFKYGP